MSVYISTHVWHTSQLRGTALLLVLALADQANDEGVSWPSMATLAHKTRLSERSVQNLMAEVLSSGEVVVLKEARGGHSPRVYQVMAPEPPDHPRRKPAPRGAKAAPLNKPDRDENNSPLDDLRGADVSPLNADDDAPDLGVQNPVSRGAEFALGVQFSEPGVQLSVSRGEAGCTQTVLNRQLEPSIEPCEPSRASAREGEKNGLLKTVGTTTNATDRERRDTCLRCTQEVKPRLVIPGRPGYDDFCAVCWMLGQRLALAAHPDLTLRGLSHAQVIESMPPPDVPAAAQPGRQEVYA